MLSHKPVAELAPINVRVGHQMGIEIARGSAEFGREGDVLELFHLPLHAVGENHDFLAQGGGRCRLAVSMGQHGDVCPLSGPLLQQREDGLITGFEHLFVALLQQQGDRSVVDVLRGETEMYKLFILLQAQGVEPAFDEIFHCLYVMVGGFLYLLHLKGVLLGKIAIDIAQLFLKFGLLGKKRLHGQL